MSKMSSFSSSDKLVRLSHVTLQYQHCHTVPHSLDTQNDICNSGNLILHGSIGHLGHVVKMLRLISRQHGGDVEHSHHHGCHLVGLRSHGGLEVIGFAGWVTLMMLRQLWVKVSCHQGLHGWHTGHGMLTHTLKIQGGLGC